MRIKEYNLTRISQDLLSIIYMPILCYFLITKNINLDHPELLTNVKLRQMNSIGVTWELWSLVNKVVNIHGLLRKQLDICYEHIGQYRYQDNAKSFNYSPALIFLFSILLHLVRDTFQSFLYG